MTFKELQDALIADVEDILKDMITTNANDEQVVGFKGYAHALPMVQSDEDDPYQYFPYFIVRFDHGKTKDDDDFWHVATDIIIGVHDMSYHGGHEHVLIAIQRILDRFAWEPKLARKFRAEQDMQWVIDEDDTYPFYIGAVEITFSVPKMGRKDGYLECMKK